METKQTPAEQQRLFFKTLGHNPLKWNISENHPSEYLPFHLLSIWLFCKLFNKYGDGVIKLKFDSCGNDFILFTLDAQKTNGVEGSFVCKPGSQGKSYSYSIQYYSLDDPDFYSGINFPKFMVVTGYKHNNELVWRSPYLQESELSISINGPKFESELYLKEFKNEFFLVSIISEYLMPLFNWIKRKETIWRNSHDKLRQIADCESLLYS